MRTQVARRRKIQFNRHGFIIQREAAFLLTKFNDNARPFVVCFSFRDGVQVNQVAPLFICLILQRGDAPAAATASQPKIKNPYPVFVWRDGGPKPSPAWAAQLKQLGFTGANIEGDDDPARLTELGLEFYADHLANRATFHRDTDDPEWIASRDGYVTSRARASLLRKPSLADPEVLVNLRKQSARRAAAAASAGARFISITDEPSYTAGLCPLDYDQSESSILQFQRNLKNRYADLNTLIKTWGAPAASFSELKPWTADEIFSRELSKNSELNFSPWADAREHSDQLFTEALGVAMAEARDAAPGTPVGFLGCLAPGAYGGYDWGKLLALKPTVLEIYDSGPARDLVRALAPSIELVDTTFTTDSFSLYPPNLAAARMSWLFARGGRNCIVWANSALFHANSGEPTESAALVGGRAKLLRSLAEKIDGGKPEFDDIAIVYSHASIQIGWILDARRDHRTWIKRTTSYELEHSTALASLDGWFRICEDLGYTPSAVDARALDGGTVKLPKILILPRTLALSDGAARALRDHAAKGGFLICEGRPGLFTENLIGRGARGALDDLFQLKETAFNGFSDENCYISPSATRAGDGGPPILETKLTSDGGAPGSASFAERNALLLNYSMVEYRDRRLEPANKSERFTRDQIGAAIAKNIGPPRFFVKSDSGLLPLSAHRERRGNDIFVFVVPNVRRAPSSARRAGIPVTVNLSIANAKIELYERVDVPDEPRVTASGRTTTLQFEMHPLHLALFRFQLSGDR